MICPTCEEWDVGNGPWKSWYRCANCDVHPETSIYIQQLKIRVEEKKKKIVRQAKIITRLEKSRKDLKEQNKDFLDAMCSEYMSCPYCHGTLSVSKEFHAEYCPLYSRTKRGDNE